MAAIFVVSQLGGRHQERPNGSKGKPSNFMKKRLLQF